MWKTRLKDLRKATTKYINRPGTAGACGVESHRGRLFYYKEGVKMEEKKTKKSKKAEALEHIERIKAFGPAYYRKNEVIKILRAFVEMYCNGRR